MVLYSNHDYVTNISGKATIKRHWAANEPDPTIQNYKIGSATDPTALCLSGLIAYPLSFLPIPL